ncbi:MAG TPA: alpha/beta family hydrolase [Candidatus Binataceae bacterium]|nr:alpha/beta family hydrolase [Candidatus Binataceae bacterium]
MSEKPVTFRSGNLTLEGILHQPESKSVGACVVCHPHPLYGGSMYNNVVDAVVEAMGRRNWSALRFNFRGVGGSEGEHSGGIGEAEDAIAASEYVAEQTGLPRGSIVVAGYSFGAMATASAAPKLGDVAGLLLIALPLRMADLDGLTQFKGPILLAAGDMDNYCPAADLKRLGENIGGRAQVQIVNGADHFFGGREDELTEAISEMIATI